MSNEITSIYSSSQEERSRQNFVGSLKAAINGSLEAEIALTYEADIKLSGSDLEKQPTNRRRIVDEFSKKPLFQLWETLNYASQDLLWETCGLTVDRLQNRFEQRASELIDQGKILGKLELDADLSLPLPIRDVEVHRQPGGYFHDQENAGLTAALLYMGSVEIYKRAKGFAANAQPGSVDGGHHFANMVRAKYPDLKPKKILDLGCGVGHMAMGLKQIWPDAEVHGIDLSAPFLKLAHLWSSEMGLAMHWHQKSAANTKLDANSFDLIVSQILFHETSHEVLPEITNEAYRLLAKDGVFFNLDVPYQTGKLTVPEVATHAWQFEFNGEPFWTGFVDTDMRQTLLASGFAEQRVFSEYRSVGGGREFYLFGGQR